MGRFIPVILFVGAWSAFVWAVIRADRKAEEAYNVWYNHPDQIWNQWKE